MAPHYSTLAWKIPWTEKPGGLQSMASLRVGQHWATSLSLFTSMHWRRRWQPTPVFLPGESQGRRSLVVCRLWGCRVGHDWSDLAAAAAAYIIVPCDFFFISVVLVIISSLSFLTLVVFSLFILILSLVYHFNLYLSTSIFNSCENVLPKGFPGGSAVKNLPAVQ